MTPPIVQPDTEPTANDAKPDANGVPESSNGAADTKPQDQDLTAISGGDPVDEPEYLTLDLVISLHDAIVERTGSPHSPLIHPDKLDSALNRPRQAAWYEGADLIRQAVVLAVGISQSQAFLDGNKRAAFAAFRVFLKVNGLFCQGDPLEIAQQLEAVAEATGGPERERKTDAFEAWVRDRVPPLIPD